MSASDPVSHGEATHGAPLLARMTARSPGEAHRASTPLELLFDLVFVVAIAQAASGLHHAIAEGHAAHGLGGYLMVFFAIWWAWMNFTWFASAYDCDDVPYRLAVFVQIAGALILAAGVHSMFESQTPDHTVIVGYVVMRLSMVAMWLRASASDSDPARRTTARRYAAGVTALQVAWVGTTLLPGLWLPLFIVLVACEVMVPMWAERAAPTTWHPQHIAERYGLLTLIVLGESIAAAAGAIQSALSSGEAVSALAPLIIGGLLIVYGMWWVYFDRPVYDLLTSFHKGIIWGYGHYAVFAAAAAVGAGLSVSVDYATHHAEVSAAGAGAAVAIPVAVYLACLWLLHDRPEYRQTRALGAITAGLVLLTPLTNYAVPLTGGLLTALVAIKIILRGRTS
jgi:low temperature requirement protein LtrA